MREPWRLPRTRPEATYPGGPDLGSMGFLALGIVLIILGVVLSFTNLFGFAGLGGSLVWIGWICIGIGLVLAILHFVMGPRRTTVVERRYREI